MYIVARAYSIKVLKAGEVVKLATEAMEMIWMQIVHNNIATNPNRVDIEFGCMLYQNHNLTNIRTNSNQVVKVSSSCTFPNRGIL